MQAAAMPAVQLLPPPPDWAARRTTASQRGSRTASPFLAAQRQGSSPFRASLSPAASSGSLGAGAAMSTCDSDGFGDFMGSDEAPNAGADGASSVAPVQRNGALMRQGSGAPRRSSGSSQPSGELDSTDLLHSWSGDGESGEAVQGIQGVQGAPRQNSLPSLPSSAQSLPGAFAQLDLQAFAAGYRAHAERGGRRPPLSEHDFTARSSAVGWALQQPSKPQPRWR